MGRQNNLLKNTAILSLGTVLPKFITVLLTPILTSQLTKTEYGQYDLVTTLVSLLLPIATLQISSAAFRFLIDHRDDKKNCKSIVSTIFTFVLLTSSVVCIVFYLIIRNRLGTNGILVCLYFMADILLITTQQVMRGIGKNLMYSLSTIIRSVIDVCLIALLTGIIAGVGNYGINGVLWAMVISTFSAFAFLFVRGGVWQYLSIRAFECSRLKSLLKYSWPMVPNNLSLWVLRLSDRLVITAVLGIEANAIYAVANKLPTIFSTFQTTFTLAWQENASIAVNDGDKDVYYSSMFDWIFSLLTGVMAVLIASTPIIWKLLIRGDYDQAYYQLPVLYLGVMFSCMASTLGGIYVAHMRTKSIGITTMVSAGINLLIDILFVRMIGIWAGSISTMVAYLFLFVFRMIDVQKFQRLTFKKSKLILSFLLLALMSIINFQKILWLDITNVVICIVILILFDRTIAVNVVKTIYKKLVKNRKR